jgi:prolyl oligopeptidase
MQTRQLSGWSIAVACAVLATVGCASKTDNDGDKTVGEVVVVEAVEYPETRRGDQVDEYHGVKVADPYRWLEDDVRESTEVAEWVVLQNAVARAYLDAIPQRPAIVKRLKELWDYERYSTPTAEGGKYFYLKNDGLQDQDVLYVADSYDAEGRVLLDPNKWSKDGTIALGGFAASNDGRRLGYTRSEAGSDWQQIHVLDVESGEPLPDQLKWIRFSGLDWNKDGTGLYYSRYPEPPEGQQYQSTATDQMVYFHALGTDQADDRLIYSRPDEPDWSFGVAETDDGQYLVLMVARGTDPQNQVFYRPSGDADGEWTELIGDFENQFSFLGNEGEQFYFLTDLDAPTKRVVKMDVAQPGRDALTEIVPASEATLEAASILSGRLIAQYLEDVLPRVRVFDLAGKPTGEVKLPGLGAVYGFGGDQDDTETFYIFTSYNTPSTIYRYDVLSGESKVIRRPDLKFDPERFVVEQVFYESKDGTRVPMLLAYKKDLGAGLSVDSAGAGDRPAHTPRPTLLYGYGGFSISILPSFAPHLIVWMEMGGVFAVANLRGGGEYGEDWHVAGKRLDKQTVFDDFISAAEWLIVQGRTSSDQLAIMGGSNGGLLVGAVETQRPELFGACIPIVGVMDMLRFHQFTAGQFWRDEYGSADDPEQFKALLAYSPYHNIKDGTKYPATLIMTADTDDRVVPMHSFKFGAALQLAQAGDAPILLRIETRAGHGRGTPVSKLIDNAADRWAFLVKSLGMNPQEE